MQIGIQNPVFASIRGIQWSVYSAHGDSIEFGKLDSALSCTTMNLSPGTPRFKLLWGIDSSYSDANNLWFGIYSAKSGGKLGPANSINIGFLINSPSPLNT